MLSDEIIQEYIDADGGYCPFCRSKDIEYSVLDTTWEGEDQILSCKHCGKSWREVYVLKLVAVELEESDDEEDTDQSSEVLDQGQSQEA